MKLQTYREWNLTTFHNPTDFEIHSPDGEKLAPGWYWSDDEVFGEAIGPYETEEAAEQSAKEQIDAIMNLKLN